MRTVHINHQARIADLPLSNVEVTQAYQNVAHLEQELERAKESLHKAVMHVQDACSHAWEEERQNDPQYGDDLRFGADLLVARLCQECGLYVGLSWKEKWNGYPYWTCRMCLGKRVNEDISQNPIILGEVSYTSKYTCQDCGHFTYEVAWRSGCD